MPIGHLKALPWQRFAACTVAYLLRQHASRLCLMCCCYYFFLAVLLRALVLTFLLLQLCMVCMYVYVCVDCDMQVQVTRQQADWLNIFIMGGVCEHVHVIDARLIQTLCMCAVSPDLLWVYCWCGFDRSSSAAAVTHAACLDFCARLKRQVCSVFVCVC